MKKKVRASSEAEKLRAFLVYFERQWLKNCKPEMWSISDSNWRANNFGEGNERLQVNFYRNLC